MFIIFLEATLLVLRVDYKKLIMDLINKLIPTRRQTVVKVFLTSKFPFNFDKWAPKYPPAKEPINNKNNIFWGTVPILLK